MSDGVQILLRGGHGDRTRHTFPAVPPEIRVPYEVEHGSIVLPDGVHDWKVDRYFPSFLVAGVFVFFSTVDPNKRERAQIAVATGQSFR